MLLKASILLPALLVSLTSWAINPHDEYYADDIFTAIDEAKKRPHHYDYSNAKRYNRSTTQSLEIPRLLNAEMETTSINTDNAKYVSAEDTPVGEKTAKDYKNYDDEAINHPTASIQSSSPIPSNPNVISPNVTINVHAR